MSNRKAHRRARSYRRYEKFIQQRLRRPGRSEATLKKIEHRKERRTAKLELAPVVATAEDPT